MERAFIGEEILELDVTFKTLLFPAVGSFPVARLDNSSLGTE